MRVRQVNPQKIRVPDVRMTSRFDADEYAELLESVRAQGILVPIRVTLQGDELLLVDGLNRLRAAVELGLARVPVVVAEGDLAGNLVQNVVTNRMRGRSAPGELVQVVKALQEELGLEPEEIEERIGLSRGYLKQLLRVAEASPRLLEAVGRRAIPLGVAMELARVPGSGDQETLLEVCLQGRFHVDDARRAVDTFLENLARAPADRAAVADLPLGQVRCTVCRTFKSPLEFEAPIVCRPCWGSLLTLWGASSGPIPITPAADVPPPAPSSGPPRGPP